MRTIRWRAALTVAVLGLTVWVLWLAGRPLGTPPVRSWVDASRWYELVGPAVAVVAVVRVAAIVVALWLLVAAALQLVATVLPRPSVRLLADLIAPRSLQRLVHGLAGLSLTAGLAVPAPGAGILGEPRGGVAVLRLIEDPPPGAGTATMRVVADPSMSVAPAAPAATPAPLGTVATPSADRSEPPPGTVTTPDVVVVESGDSLWSIAEEALVDAGDAVPSDAVVERYWRRLIEANLSTLVEPTNPDLIYAGQVITLPAP